VSVRVSKWGNSLAVRLPRALVAELKLSVGDEVALEPAGPNALRVAKRDAKAEFLAEMERFRWKAPKGHKFDRDEANER